MAGGGGSWEKSTPEALCNGPPLFRSGILTAKVSTGACFQTVPEKSEGLLFSLVMQQKMQLKLGN